MIGSFFYSEALHPNDIMVDLRFDEDGQRQAWIILPAELRELVRGPSYPLVDDPFTIESAMAFAVFVAMKANRSLVVTGDPSVWDPAWGALVSLQLAGDRITGVGS